MVGGFTSAGWDVLGVLLYQAGAKDQASLPLPFFQSTGYGSLEWRLRAFRKARRAFPA